MAALCACVAAAAPSAAAADAGGGGVMYVATPRLKRVKCIRRCASHRRPRGGSTLRITGTDLGGVRYMTFHGTYGRGDDITVRVRSGSATRLNARVPLGAIAGPVSVKTAASVSSRRTRAIRILPAPPPSPNPTLPPVPALRDAGAPRLETGTSRTAVFVDARRAVVFSYRISGRLARTVKVDLVSATDGAVVKSWTQPSVAPGMVQTIAWSGKIGRSAAHNGRYSFRVTAQGTDGAIARSTKAS